MYNFQKDLKVLFEEKEIQEKIKELAKEIDEYYRGEEVVVISVLKGAIFFTVDLVKKMKTPMIIDMIQVSSYQGTQSTGNVIVKKDLNIDVKDKNVLLVEDIIDTGYTLKYLKDYIKSLNPKDLKVAVLLDKKERREVEVNIDYCGFVIPNKFVVGYGFDVDEIGRNIPYIGYIE